jgi:hypothetical protein
MLGNLCSSDAHCEANICLLQGRGIIGAITSDSNYFTKFPKASDKKVLVLWARTSKDSKVLGHGLKSFKVLDTFLNILSVAVARRLLFAVSANKTSHSIIELRTFHHTVGEVRQLFIDYTTFSCDSLGSYKVITGNHSDLDSSFLALLDCQGNLRPDNILDTNNANKGVTAFLDFIEPVTFLEKIMLGATFSSLQIFVTKRYGPEGLARINSDSLEEALLDTVGKRNFLSLLVQIVLAFIENDFGSTLHVDSSVIIVFSLAAVVDNG